MADQFIDNNGLGKKGIKEIIDIERSINIKADESKTKQKVCIYYLQGTCRYSDQECSFLHANVEEKVSICKYYKENGFCSKEDQCHFRHPKNENNMPTIAPNGSAAEPCPYYERGFCHRGGECRFLQHELSQIMQMFYAQENMGQNMGMKQFNFEICPNYMAGFCPKGSMCQQRHLKSVIIDENTSLKQFANFPDSEDYQMPLPFTGRIQNRMWPQKPTVCHNCGKEGHKSTYCLEDKIDRAELAKITQFIGHERVLCFNCSQYGHYANMCPLKKEIQGSQSAVKGPDGTPNDFSSMPPPDPISKRGYDTSYQETQRKQIEDRSGVKKNITLTGSQVNLKDWGSLPFSKNDLNNAIKDLAQKIVERQARMSHN